MVRSSYVERSRSRDNDYGTGLRSGRHDRNQADHEDAHIPNGNAAGPRSQRAQARQRRCNSQDIFLMSDGNDDVYSWEFGQPFRGAHKERWIYDRDCQRKRGQPQTRGRTNVKCHELGGGLGILRKYGSYHNAGPALGDLHRALRRGVGPDVAARWNNDLFEGDNRRGPNNGSSKPRDNRGRQNLEEADGSSFVGERNSRLRAWAD